ncbi:MAG TPA: autotransporter-associated beta strand repeat-containing protein, partial [Pirellulales bacterium]|nr:autotransporter-associated beta strand repeat-containing protein [Pirellulales bacterium]
AGVLEATASISTGRSFVFGDPGSTILVDAGQTYAITNTAGSGISGSGTLNATGAGILALDDTLNANTFTGGSVIGGGTVQIFTSTSLGDVSGTATINAGVLEATASISTGRSFVFGDPGSTILVDAGQTYAITNTAGSGISGSGTLNATGAGILALDDTLNPNTFTGGSVINGGTVQIFTSTSLGDVSGTATINAATLEAAANITTARNFALGSGTSAIKVDSGMTYTINGTLADGAGPGTLNVAGPGTLALTGNNTYSGGTSVSGGMLQLDNATGSASGTGGVTLSGTGILSTTLGNTIAGNLAVGTGTSVVAGGTGTLAVNGAGGMIFDATNGATLSFNLSGANNGSINIANTLNFGLTSGVDTITIDGTAQPKTYVLMTFGSENVVGGDFLLGAHPTDGNIYTLQNTGTQELLIVTAGTPTSIYFSGAIDGNWNTLTDGNSNWVNGPMGTGTGAIPDSNSDVFLTANTASHLSTTLGQDFTINSLTFTGTGTSSTAGSSIGGANTLTIDAAAGAYAAGTGITVLSGSGPDAISANLALGASQTWNLAGGTTLTVSGGISELAAGTTLTVNTSGSGTLALNDTTTANSFTGGVTINGGTVQIFTPTSLGASTGAVTIGAGTLEAAADITDNRSVVLGNAASAILVDSGKTFNLGGVVSGSGNLNFDSTGGTLVLAGSANNTYSGQTLVTNGTLQLSTTGGAIGIVGDGTATKASGANLQTGADLVITGGNLLISNGDNNVLASNLTVTLAGGTMNIGRSTQSIYDFNGTGGTFIAPRGSSWTVSDPNYFGSRMEFVSTINDTNDNLSRGSVLVLHGDEGSGAGGNGVLTINAPGAGNTVALTFSQQDANNDSSQIRVNSESGSNTAAGKLILNGDVVVSMTSGGASIINGLSQLDGSGGLGTGPWTDNGYGSLAGVVDLGGANRTFTIGSSTHDGSNPLDPGVDMLVSAQIQNGGIIKDGPGTLFLSNAGNGQPNSAVANTFTGGVTINAGTIQIDSSMSLGAISGLTTINAGTLEAVANIDTTRAFTLGSSSSTILVDSGMTYTIGGAISETSPSVGALNATGAGTLVLSGTNTYSLGTNISNGTVSVSSDSNLGNASGGVTLSSGGTLAVTTGFTSSRNFSVGSGGGNLNVSSGQTFTASGNGTWSGNNSGGTLTLNGGGTVILSAGTGSYGSAAQPLSLVTSSGTLAGTATVLGNVTINSGATISPGASAAVPGTLTFNGTDVGTSTLNSGGTFGFNILNAGGGSSNLSIGSAGTNWNLLATNSLTVNSTPLAPFNVAVSGTPTGFNPSLSYQWDFLTVAGGLPGGLNANEFALNTSAFHDLTTGSFSIALGTMTGGIGYVAVDYSPSAVPEPASMILAGFAALGMAGMGWRQRRRRQPAAPQLDETAGA